MITWGRKEAEENEVGGEGVVVTFRTRFLHVIDDVQLQGGGYCILHPSYNLSVFSNVLKDKKNGEHPRETPREQGETNVLPLSTRQWIYGGTLYKGIDIIYHIMYTGRAIECPNPSSSHHSHHSHHSRPPPVLVRRSDRRVRRIPHTTVLSNRHSRTRYAATVSQLCHTYAHEVQRDLHEVRMAEENLLVLYASVTGTAQDVAEHIWREARRRGYKCKPLLYIYIYT